LTVKLTSGGFIVKKIRSVILAIRYFGPCWIARRLGYWIRLHSGYLKWRMPALKWSDYQLSVLFADKSIVDPEAYLAYRRSDAPKFFFDTKEVKVPTELQSSWDKYGIDPVSSADDLAAGKFIFFGHKQVYTGFPPDWHQNAITGQRTPADRHWTQIDDFEFDDIKIIWEINRFSFVYLLVRAYSRSENEKYAKLFWELVEDWYNRNPPQIGANWKCGQEISFRIMALCFGLYGFLYSKATTPIRVARLARIIAVSALRIEKNFQYAIHQRNNHGISEALGLWTIGTLFPEFKKSEKWIQLGKKHLETQGLELIYDDGAFTQHSLNYHRLMLHVFTWCIRLGEINSQPFSKKLKNQLARAVGFLYQIQDETTGSVPRYGQNDGALILPLNNCDLQDYRPVIQSAYYMNTGNRLYDSGPWDEDLYWLFGTNAVRTTLKHVKRTDLQANIGGYYTLRTRSGFCFTRCATFKDRPGQADMLHTDLWWRGQNIALDPGTFSYNSPDPWNNPFAHSAYHNTVTVDEMDQMDRVSKFIWLPWLHCKVNRNERSENGQLSYFEGEHNGYKRLISPVSHRRGLLRIGDEHWLILDRLLSDKEHTYRLHWLCPDLRFFWDERNANLQIRTLRGEYQIKLRTVSGKAMFSLMRASNESNRGWYSPYYYNKAPAISIDLRLRASSVVFLSLFGPSPTNIALYGEEIEITTDTFKALIYLSNNTDDQRSIFDSVSIDGFVQDRMVLI